MSRCTGHCCERFTVPLGVLTDPSDRVKDGDFIRDMLIFLDDEKPVEPEDRIFELYYFTCRHFDRSARSCTVYEQRPHLCRNHGVTYPCTHQGCTLTHGDSERVPAAERT